DVEFTIVYRPIVTGTRAGRVKHLSGMTGQVLVACCEHLLPVLRRRVLEREINHVGEHEKIYTKWSSDAPGARLLTLWALARKHSQNVPRQTFLDLAVARNRLRNAGRRISIPIVLRAVANQHAAQALDLAHKIDSLHATSRSSTLRMPGISPLVNS